MPVLAVVATLPPGAEDRAALIGALAADPRVTLGPLHQDRLPLVLDSATREEDAALWRRVEALPGLRHLELVFADFSDLHEEPPPCP